MATHSSILAGESHGQRSLEGYSPWGAQSWTRLKQLSIMHASTFTRIKSCLVAAADFQHPLKEFRVKSKNEALCAQGKAGRTGLQIDILRN